MGRVFSIDYGQKRVGLAVSDPMKMIANKLGTVNNGDLFNYIESYFAKEKIDTIVIGYPVNLKNEPMAVIGLINPFITKLHNKYPDIQIVQADERFTSKIAFQTMIDAGLKKKQRQDKGMIDAVSAVIILQTYLESIR